MKRLIILAAIPLLLIPAGAGYTAGQTAEEILKACEDSGGHP